MWWLLHHGVNDFVLLLFSLLTNGGLLGDGSIAAGCSSDRTVPVTTLAFQYFGMHVFFYLCTEFIFIYAVLFMAE